MVLYDIDSDQGIKHLHDHQLCHFDIKPANIFIAQDGVTCKLGDFGLVVSEEQVCVCRVSCVVHVIYIQVVYCIVGYSLFILAV